MSPNSPSPSEVAPTPADDFIVERLRCGPVDYTILLFSHTGENASAMRQVLDGCDVIALEQPGHNGSRKRRNHDTTPTADLGVQQAVDDLAEKRRGFVYIDIHQDDPNYPIVLEAKAKQTEYYRSIVALDPPSETRESLLDAARATAHSYAIRDGILRRQLSELPHKVGDAKVGVVLGSMHYRAITGLDPNLDANRLRQRIHVKIGPLDHVIEAIRDQMPVDPADIDRALVSIYMLQYGIKALDAAGNDLVERLEPELAGRILHGVEGIVTSDTTYENASKELDRYLRAVAGMLSDPEQFGE